MFNYTCPSDPELSCPHPERCSFSSTNGTAIPTALEGVQKPTELDNCSGYRLELIEYFVRYCVPRVVDAAGLTKCLLYSMSRPTFDFWMRLRDIRVNVPSHCDGFF